MKIAQLFVQANPPFSDFQVDFTYPEGHERAGQALDKVCLIGPNGAGKSSLMKLLTDYLRNTLRFKSKSLFIAKLQLGDRFIYSVHLNNSSLFFREEIDQEPTWIIELIRDQSFTLAFNRNYEQYCIGHEEEPELFDSLWFDNNSDDLILVQPADYNRDKTIGLQDVPATRGHEPESLIHTFPLFNEVSPAMITEFWSLLIYLIMRRKRMFREYVESAENQGMPEESLRMMFAESHPEVLPELAKIWAPVLDHLGLELDLENAEVPNSIKERLKIYLKTQHKGERVEYGDLGTGLRRLLFSLGHTWALFFLREIKHGFCLLEEPENGLHPGFLPEIVPFFQRVIQGSQLFVSTHHPMIAASFEPAERLILARDRKGHVEIRRSQLPSEAGVAEILLSDFS